ncbi:MULTISPECIES: ABC transporter ATP-binding protein [unclassified Salipiger]|uniref:ABC transporter ATP-binding protein n=1 Tax=unclassified Salipiger TaxID=2640570 RepID=UPI0013BE3CEA|nr:MULTISPECIES: ABC transporter ATP-binding protein [unclassified Salipiger]NDV51371.1 ABC transporter ATP-binding protein [Salipiger sp. PrR003]NDW32964.1 ABC transporter ATP-binding protein [Salipiger sp. PrR007]
MTMTQAATAPSGATAPLLSVRELTVSVRDRGVVRPLVAGLSFDLHAGETLAIAGESGSGKSITSLALMGLLPNNVAVTSGQALLDGTDLPKLPEPEMRNWRGARLAMIFQEPMTSLNPVHTIGSQMTEAIRAHAPVAASAARAQAVEALRKVRIPEPERRMKQFPHELSGGMRQRVMIAMALALRPALLIADEPTTALDVTVQQEVLELLRDLQAETGTAIILITHDMGVVAESADRVVVMRQGRMVESAPVDTLFAAPQHDYTRSLLAAVPRLGAGAERAKPLPPVSTAPAARLVDARVHFDIGSDFFGRPTHRVHAVEKVSFDIRPGETFGLVGESGCGKSTIAKALSGLVPHVGHIEVDGKALAGLTDRGRRDICRDIQMVFQDPMAALDPRMTVGEAVMEPLLIHGIGSAEDRIARATELFERVGLSAGQMQRYPHEFSGGQRQRICVARALALKPKLIICDESVSALDVSVQAQVLALLEELQQETGVSYLFISHDMAVVENVVDRLAVMYLGQIVEMGTRDQVFGNPQHSYTRRLLDAVPIPDPSRKGRPHARRATDLPSPIWKINEGPTPVSLRDIGAGHLVAEDG